MDRSSFWKTTRHILLAGIVVFTPPLSSGVMADGPADSRIDLGFTPEEKATFLADMRMMLGSVQGILRGISEEDREAIAEAAQVSGNRMARGTPASIRDKTPPEFKAIGGPMHMTFEEIAIRAETDPLEDITAMTAEAMNQCMTCHAQFRVD
ncbi:MAG: hypothetical protein ACLFMY_00305 [Guyparkeria sp.]|uniref:hypothetical protein n=1 Tax=Guyparkeria sp. TaxID=2035736 RepID=UPI00397E701C